MILTARSSTMLAHKNTKKTTKKCQEQIQNKFVNNNNNNNVNTLPYIWYLLIKYYGKFILNYYKEDITLSIER